MLEGENKIDNSSLKEDCPDDFERAIAIWEFIKAAAPPDRAELIRAFYPSIFEGGAKDIDPESEARPVPQELDPGPDEFDTSDETVDEGLNPMWDADWDDVF